MRRLRAFFLMGFILAVTAPSARAEGFVTPFYGYNFGGDSGADCQRLAGCETKRKNFGVSFGTMGTVFGFEEDVSFAKDFFASAPSATGDNNNSIFSLMSNVLIGVGRGPVQPYVLFGAGLVRSHTSVNLNQFKADNNSLGYDLGIGVNGFFSKNVGIRGDVRHFHTLQDLDVPVITVFNGVVSEVFVPQKLDFWRASIGLALRF